MRVTVLAVLMRMFVLVMFMPAIRTVFVGVLVVMRMFPV